MGARLVIFLGPLYIPSIDGISGVSGSPKLMPTGFSKTASPDVQGVLGYVSFGLGPDEWGSGNIRAPIAPREAAICICRRNRRNTCKS